ncbi:MAG: hypothetical protein ACFCU6_13215, partial [Balneolaceae bacterium]
MKTVTKALSILVIFLMGTAGTMWAQDVTDIADARTQDGEVVTIEGILNTPDYGFNNNQFFMQDETGGINVFIPGSVGFGLNSTADSPFSRGDIVKITGTIGSFNSQVQIQPAEQTDVEIISSGNTLPDPVNITEEELTVDSPFQGMLVRLATTSLAEGEVWPADAQVSSGVNVNAVFGDTSYQIRIDRDESFFDGAPEPTEKFVLAGPLGRNNDDVQVWPFVQSDIQNIVTVTFNVNTATFPDTLKSTDVVQIRGGINETLNGAAYAGATVTWDSGTEWVPENQGGDFWSFTTEFAAGQTMNYKYWGGSSLDDGLANANEVGWESGDNREFSVGLEQTEDIELALTWFETRDQAPFESFEDSLTVFFRVNVGAFVQDGTFDPEAEDQFVGIRGADPFLDWGVTIPFDLETRHANSGDNWFYSGVARIDNAGADTLKGTNIAYKYVIEVGESVVWEDGPDRIFVFPEADSTVHWRFFSDTPPTTGQIVTANVDFSVNVGILEGLGFFNSGIGDAVHTLGDSPITWDVNESTQMTFDNVDLTWRFSKEITKAANTTFKYKYFIAFDESRQDPMSENYIPGIPENLFDFGFEEPVTT